MKVMIVIGSVLLFLALVSIIYFISTLKKFIKEVEDKEIIEITLKNLKNMGIYSMIIGIVILNVLL